MRIVDLLNLLTETVSKLHHHLQTATVFSGTCNVNQNDIIECISHFFLNKIKEMNCFNLFKHLTFQINHNL